jgi:plasmid maintenance system antidote protein VapI
VTAIGHLFYLLRTYTFHNKQGDYSVKGCMEITPETVQEALRSEMQDRQLNYSQLATLLQIPLPRLSEVMHGRRKMNMDLAKRMWKILGMDPDRILRLVD